ncbi:sensor histidine kinase [Gillisia limnaea]|uniref:histidine kinase n=1 Tax=Gillisia limnaea (strain DSM 15749 / LMG 21470 / R-8282) TaxID=865937 RepID=H2BVJ9_GILLR|nr:sensor histidine kinase [Gillisia limnaea]EHQ02907.1 histidine kinase [Gillisia limnaea DSM 15749]
MKKTARLLNSKRDEVIDRWEKEVLQQVKAAPTSNKIALQDHVPNILDDIIEILNRHENTDDYFNDEKIHQIEENSLEHGRHRANSPNYTVDQIIHEYMIFNNVIISVLHKNDIAEESVFHLIKCSIDKAMLNSVTSFSESIQEMQNKLIGTLAHDIRNPLAAARMAIEMINYETGRERFEKVKKMSYNSVNRAIELVEGLLDSITVKAGEGIMLSFSETDLNQDIQTIYEEACEVFSEDIILKKKEQSIKGVFDGTAIRRLMENLINNAVKYGHSEKPVTITITNEDDWLKISVHNFGEPIPLDKQKEIFNFMEHGIQQRGKKLKSYGIGLTLVKMVAEAHGGSVELKSTKDFGTEFKIKLNKHKNAPGKKRTILNTEA